MTNEQVGNLFSLIKTLRAENDCLHELWVDKKMQKDIEYLKYENKRLRRIVNAINKCHKSKGVQS
jgi:hypothetical protein